MWTKIAHTILKRRPVFLIIVALITVFMGYHARKVQKSYELAQLVPPSDIDYQYLKNFKAKYGEDGNIIAIGLKDPKVYQLKNFNELKKLADEIKKLKGITQVLSLPRMQYMAKDTANKKFVSRSVFAIPQKNQATLDSLLNFAKTLKVYENQLVNAENGATMILASMRKDILNSPERDVLIKKMYKLTDQFIANTNITLHFAGVPVVRSMMMTKVGKELTLLLVASLIATALILLLFFKSLKAVFFPLTIIGVVVIWTMGMLGLFQFEITILTGLLPPILVVIGIPNAVYLLNKYHQEFRKHGNKIRALSTIIRKIGLVTLMTNTTTAIGFFVFSFMEINILQEFGIVASINIMSTFVVSLVLLPIFFSYLPAPKPRELTHLDRRLLNGVLTNFENIVFNHKKIVYSVLLLILVLSAVGISKMKMVAFMVDDIPPESRIKTDLAFFEKNFSGVMPLEIVIDTRRKKGVLSLRNLRQVDTFENELRKIGLLSPPVSIINTVKAARQAYYRNDSTFYTLPTRNDQSFILQYLKTIQADTSSTSNLLKAFVDTTGQTLRISLKVADVGSIKMDSLINQVVRPQVVKTFYAPKATDFSVLAEDELVERGERIAEDIVRDFFVPRKLKVEITGTTLLFIKGNTYLVNNLKNSLLLAIALISILMAVLFGSFRMILVSIITNIIPLAITAGLMGYFGVPLKPSTALIFSIAFGIAVDDSIHYLARYRQELFANKFNVQDAVKVSLKETGTGMIYTSIILFFGFIVFVTSEFQGTVSLGGLTSITLMSAMFANLLLLPSMLLSFDSGKYTKNSLQMIEEYDEFHLEDDDEEIDMELLKVYKAEE